MLRPGPAPLSRPLCLLRCRPPCRPPPLLLSLPLLRPLCLLLCRPPSRPPSRPLRRLLIQAVWLYRRTGRRKVLQHPPLTRPLTRPHSGRRKVLRQLPPTHRPIRLPALLLAHLWLRGQRIAPLPLLLLRLRSRQPPLRPARLQLQCRLRRPPYHPAQLPQQLATHMRLRSHPPRHLPPLQLPSVPTAM